MGHFYTFLILFIYLPRLLSKFHAYVLYNVQYLLLLISTMARVKVQRSTEFDFSVDFEKYWWNQRGAHYTNGMERIESRTKNFCPNAQPWRQASWSVRLAKWSGRDSETDLLAFLSGFHCFWIFNGRNFEICWFFKFNEEKTRDVLFHLFYGSKKYATKENLFFGLMKGVYLI